jgi:hypothetical protein
MSENPVSTAQLANRRGFLLGITLAEIMIITLFVLLLLFRHSQEQVAVVEKINADFGSELVKGLTILESDLPKFTPSMQKQIAEITETLVDCRKEQHPGCKRSSEEGENLDGPVVVSEAPPPDSLDDARLQLNQANEELSDLEDKLAAARKELLERGRKSGEKPFCTYRSPSKQSNSVKGPNIDVGLFLIEGDGITLVERDKEFLENKSVDFNGEPYDAREAINELKDWPICKKLSFEAFAERGKTFMSIGKQEVETRMECRFSGDYFYVVSEATVLADEREFQEYFFLGARQTSSDYMLRSQCFNTTEG